MLFTKYAWFNNQKANNGLRPGSERCYRKIQQRDRTGQWPLNICDVYFQHRWFTKLLWWGFITPSRSEGSRGTSEYIWWRERAEVKPEEDGGHTNQPYTKSHRNPPPPPPQASLSLPSSSLGLLLWQQRSSAQEIDENASRKRIIGVSGLCVLVSLSLIGCTCFLAAHDHAWKHNNLTLGQDHCFLLASYLDFFFFFVSFSNSHLPLIKELHRRWMN